MKKTLLKLISLFIIIAIISCKKDDAPANIAPIVADQTFTVAEDIASNTPFATVVATDENELTFTITTNSNDLFTINNTGELSLVEGKNLDFETATTHIIAVKVFDGELTTKTIITINIEDINENRPFITTWQTTTANETITIATLSNTYNYTIDWGDGTVATNQTTEATHSYTVAGKHTIKISGVYPQIVIPTSEREKLLEVTQWGTIKWESMEDAFRGCSNLKLNTTDIPDLSLVTNMGGMFSGATSFNQDISGWDVSNVTNMGEMFERATSFNQEISAWNVSKVVSMAGMFLGATNFNQDISSWDVSNVFSMYRMFESTGFNQDISGWDVSNVTNMESMFWGATSFNQDISTWDVSNVTNMWSMFSEAISFNQDVSAWNVSNVTSMWSMFSGVISFNQDISGWDVSNVTDMWSMFDGATSFNQDISGWDVSNVTDMGSMFDGATSFNQDISGWDVSNVTDMEIMFSGATSFNQNLSGWDVSNVNLCVGFSDNSGLSPTDLPNFTSCTP